MKKTLVIVMTLLLQGCSLFGIRTVELLEYETLEKEGNFDIRQYEEHWVVRTEIKGDYKQGTNVGFNRLFQYISGNNRLQEKIEMTGPVIQQEKGEKIAMTGPVIQQRQGEMWIMEFVLPSKYNQTTPPAPLDDEVKIVRKEAYRAASITYSGTLNESKYKEKEEKLFDFIRQKNLTPIGKTFSAGYDPPWTIPFLRRNEVLVMIE